jgi:hypothetical protein
MPVTFQISIKAPTAAVRSQIDALFPSRANPQVRDFASFCERIGSNLAVAAGMWGGHFNSNERVEIEVNFEDTDSGRAGGRSKDSVSIGPSARYPGKSLIMEGAAAQIAGRGQPTTPGILITIPPNTYTSEQVWFDPDPVGRSQPVPTGLVDAVTLFLHEMAHGLGFNGRLVQDPERPNQSGKPDEEWVSTYDECVQFDGSNFFFDGPSAMAANGGLKVPLGDSQRENNNYHHVGNDAGRCDSCRSDLMTAFPWDVGRRYTISSLDLAILKDTGLPVL